jgi:hypothetical protein
MKYIQLTKGYRSAVDDKTFHILSRVKWCAAIKTSNIVYGYRNSIPYKGSKQHLSLHRMAYLVMTGKLVPDGMEVDHIDGDGLNNQISNLRVCTHKQNLSNRKTHKNNTTGASGIWVYVGKRGTKYIPTIRIEGKQTYLGRFSTMREAKEVRAKAVLENYGEYARQE